LTVFTDSTVRDVDLLSDVSRAKLLESCSSITHTHTDNVNCYLTVWYVYIESSRKCHFYHGRRLCVYRETTVAVSSLHQPTFNDVHEPTFRI